MTRKSKFFLITLLIIILLIVTTYFYVLNGGARNISSEKTLFVVNTKSITNEFKSNIDSANKKYLDKTIAISGIITAIKNHEVILNNIIICNFKNTDNSLKVDQNISVKGRLVGFDDLMGELKLDQCSLNN
jgi:uncharacterized protein YacL